MSWLYHGDPCLGCGEREVGCHAKCEKYMAWREELKRKRAIIDGDNETIRTLNQMEIERSDRIAKFKHSRRRK